LLLCFQSRLELLGYQSLQWSLSNRLRQQFLLRPLNLLIQNQWLQLDQ
jgi:hypothetical protein